MNNWQIIAISSFATVLIHGVIIYFAIVGWQLTSPAEHRKPVIEFVKAELVTLKTKAPVKKANKPKANPAPVKPVVKKPAPPIKKPLVKELKPDPVAKPKPKKIDKGALQREQLKRMQELLAEDEAAQRAEEKAQLLVDEDEQIANSYVAIIMQAIVSTWSRPPSARNGMEVTVAMQLTPNGAIVDAQVTKSSGDSVFDRSAIRAIKQVDQFPELKNMPIRIFEAKFRNLTLVFRPEDLLL